MLKLLNVIARSGALRCVAVVLALALALARSRSAAADGTNGTIEVPAQFVRVSTPDYIQSLDVAGVRRNFSPRLGTYNFKVGWGGIPAASLSLTTEQRGLYYRIVATARTYSGIDIFYKLRYRAEGLLSSLDFSPVSSRFYKEENSKQRLTEISYLDDNQVLTVNSGNNRATEVLQFDPENRMLEPFSAAFLARGLDWAVGDSKQFDTFNGKVRYLITLNCVDQTTIEHEGVERPVWVIEPRVLNLTDQTQNSKLRKAEIYVSADASREVLKISSEVFIGSVSAWLDSFEPSTAPIGGAIMAQRRVAAPALR